MKIALTGTPGTGKSSVANELTRMGYAILRLEEVINTSIIGYDKKRHSKIVDEKKLDNHIQAINEKGVLIVEGHLSHLLNIKNVIILRCHPSELKNRLMIKKWNERKIKENVEAEALDVILDTALKKCENIWEIDTTRKNPIEIAKKIGVILNTRPAPDYGKIDWSVWLMEHA